MRKCKTYFATFYQDKNHKNYVIYEAHYTLKKEFTKINAVILRVSIWQSSKAIEYKFRIWFIGYPYYVAIVCLFHLWHLQLEEF